jgi:integrase
MTSMTAGRLKALSTTPGRHRIDDGLYLLVRDVGNSTWVFRYVSVAGNRRDMTIGAFDAISLPDARAEVLRWQAERKQGRDPIEVRKASTRMAASEAKAAVTLLEYATEYHALRLPTWKNDKHAAQWLSSLNHLGKLLALPLPEITSANLLEVLEPLNLDHHETATRIRQRVEELFDRAIIAGIVSANPAASLKRALRAPYGKKHFSSLPYRDIPEFLRQLRDSDASQSTRLAFEWLVLSVGRTSEVTRARWGDLSEDRTRWTVAPEDMKNACMHEVPVTARMRDILTAMEPQRGTGWDWIFPSPQGRKECLSNGALLGVLRRMGLAGKATAHGMRASFSTWAYENTQFRREIIESAMSHQEEDAVKKAYNRATYWEQRVELAEAWSAFCLQRTT